MHDLLLATMTVEFVWGAAIAAVLLVVGVSLGIAIGRRMLSPEGHPRDHTLQLQIQQLLAEFRLTASTVVGELSERRVELEQWSESFRPEDDDPEAQTYYHGLNVASQELQDKLEQAEEALKAQADQIEYYMSEARTDGLTELPNRRAFDDDLTRRVAQFRRYGTPMSILLIDVDRFKRFNDEHGHLAGDAVLKQVAKVLRDSIRSADVAARFGGEEFAVLLPNTTGMQACIAAENIRAMIESTQFEYDGKNLQITVSGGIAEANGGDDESTLVNRADEALYAAKQAGRNRVLLHNGVHVVDAESSATQVGGNGGVRVSNRLNDTCTDLRQKLLELATEKP